jgi:VTC domain
MLQAKPKSHVAYAREAWVSPFDNSVRVTFDRGIRCLPNSRIHLKAQMDRPVYPYGRQTLLELKFTQRYPIWFRKLVQEFNLRQTGAPKYAGGIDFGGEQHFMGRGAAYIAYAF